jgi:hypothetical protein
MYQIIKLITDHLYLMEPEPSQKNLQEEEIVPVKATRLGDKEKIKNIPK